MTETGTHPSFLVGPPNDGLRQERTFARVLKHTREWQGWRRGQVRFAASGRIDGSGMTGLAPKLAMPQSHGGCLALGQLALRCDSQFSGLSDLRCIDFLRCYCRRLQQRNQPKLGPRQISAAVAPGAHAVLILDQAGWHLSAGLVIPANITLLPLPAKCPELNPVENVWQFMRDNWLSNRIFKSYDDILDHHCCAWNRLIDQPWRIMSSGLRQWAHG